jgi:hypothetical protein
MAATYTPIASITLGAAAASVTFSSIPQTYTDLVCIVNAKSSDSIDNLDGRVGNGTIDSGSNYSRTYITGDGSSAISGRTSGAAFMRFTYTGYVSSTQTGNQIIHIMNYANTTTNKTLISRANNAAYSTDMFINLWRSTAAINTFQLYTSGNGFVSGSTFNLYGILGANA